MNATYKQQLIKYKRDLIYILLLILTPIISNYLGKLFCPPSDEELYNQNKHKLRPYLSIVDEPKIDSIICYFDSLDVIKRMNILNYLSIKVQANTIPPFIKVFYRLRITNKNAIAIRVADTAIDTFDTKNVLRDFLFEKDMIVYEPDELFPWVTLSAGDTTEIKFSQFIINEHRAIPKGYIVLHILLLYESETKNLFDTYYIYHFGFNYPNYLITSKREPLRKLDNATLHFTSHEYWKKSSTENTKVYDYDESIELYRRINYYYVKSDIGDKNKRKIKKPA